MGRCHAEQGCGKQWGQGRSRSGLWCWESGLGPIHTRALEQKPLHEIARTRHRGLALVPRVSQSLAEGCPGWV